MSPEAQGRLQLLPLRSRRGEDEQDWFEPNRSNLGQGQRAVLDDLLFPVAAYRPQFQLAPMAMLREAGEKGPHPGRVELLRSN